MKRIICFALCILSGTLLFGCTKTTEPEPERPRISVFVVNEANEADVWILPDTEANRKTTLWGTATVAKLNVNDKQPASVEESESGAYLFRMIDTDLKFYSVSGIKLKADYMLTLRPTGAFYDFELLIFDENGNLIGMYDGVASKL